MARVHMALSRPLPRGSSTCNRYCLTLFLRGGIIGPFIHRRRAGARSTSKPGSPDSVAGPPLHPVTPEQLRQLFESAAEYVALHVEHLKQQRGQLAQLAANADQVSGDDVAAAVRAQLREAYIMDNRRAVEEVMYAWCLHSLSRANTSLVESVDRLGEASMVEGGKLAVLTIQDLGRLVSPAVADAVLGLVATTFGSQQQDAPAATLLTHVDRVQAARLYAGQIEYGHFVRALEVRCRQEGVELSSDSTQLVAFAGRLPKEELRAACKVQSQEAWTCAVRHTGRVFGLAQRDDGEGGGGSGGLPYPQLEVTAGAAQFMPATHLSEYYDEPGAAEAAAAAAASREARGWKQGNEAKDYLLPPPDLVTMRLDVLQSLLIEGAALGVLLGDAERMLVEEYGFPLTQRLPLEQ